MSGNLNAEARGRQSGPPPAQNTQAEGYERHRLSFLLKRAADYVGASALMLAASPLMAVTALVVWLESSGPVIFRQTRAGRFDRPFTIFKFRTMVVEAEKGWLDTSKDDPRITRVGRLLRVTSLDELPQLFNVLRGEMSIVGPRPLLPGTVRQEEARRHHMLPGMTGLPEVLGRKALGWDERMQLDLWYVDNWSFWLDVKIMLKTIPVVLLRKNVYDPEGKSSVRTK